MRNRIQFGGLGDRSTAVIEVEDFRAKASLGLNLFFSESEMVEVRCDDF